MLTLFPIAEYWWFYGGFTLFVLALLALDLGVFHKNAHEVSLKEAGIWTTVWISLALAFNFGFYQYASWKFSPEIGERVGLEFLTGFLVEKALAVDNIFVFAMIFSYFAIPKIYQHRILFYGILGALFFRAVFIGLGSYLMAYQWVVIFFGALLIFTGIKMMVAAGKGEDPSQNKLMHFLQKRLPVYSGASGGNFFVRHNGRWFVTPLFVALLFLELSDIIFAVDSVPAIFAITKEPLIVFTSNIFAILGLRSMYFLLAGVMDRFIYIKYGLAAVLVFVGTKMVWLNEAFGGKFPIAWSLGIISALIGGSVVISLIVDYARRKKELLPMAGQKPKKHLKEAI